MTTVAHVLDVARSQLGTVEGPRSNEVKYNTWFYGRVVWGARYPWCAAFVSWVLDQAGIHEVRTAGVLVLMGHFKAVGHWHAGTAGMQPGDVVIYIRPDGEHTGIAEEIRATSVRALEGNTDEAGGRTGGKVMVKDRPFATSHIAGYGRPLYSAAAAPSQPEDDDMAHPSLRLVREAEKPDRQWLIGPGIAYHVPNSQQLSQFEALYGKADDFDVKTVARAVIEAHGHGGVTP